MPKHCKVAHTKLYHASNKMSQPDWNNRKAVKAWKDAHAILLMCMEQVFVEVRSHGR